LVPPDAVRVASAAIDPECARVMEMVLFNVKLSIDKIVMGRNCYQLLIE
jgi:hypothetical protein